ncbi:MAG: Lrp/AsnC family transcriptional regulator [Pseudomonadota bacterium]
MQLDKTDRKILALLQHDASLSASEIAERVNLSQPPCWRRIKRLEEAGVIQRRVALLDQRQLGLNVTVFARIKLSAHGKRSLPEFEEQIRDLPEVLECHTVMGDYDFLLKIVTRDIDTYETLFRNTLSQMPTVQEIHSNAALSRIKITTELPLEDSQLTL